MHRYVVRRKLSSLAGLTAAMLVVACGDKRVQKLDVGITRDSAMTIIASNTSFGGHDQFPNVYTREMYINQGKTWEILFYTPDNDKVGPRKRSGPADTATVDSVPWKKLTPLVFLDNKLYSKSWDTWDSISKTMNLPMRDHKD